MNEMKKSKSTLLVVMLILLNGCVATTVQQIRHADTGIDSDQGIAILGRFSHTENETETEFIRCVANRAEGGSNGLAVMSEETFIDQLFPWFEPRRAPSNIEELGGLLDQPLIRKKVEDLGVRYLVWVGGRTERVDQSGTVHCAMATGAMPACFGFLSWEGEAEYEANVWDISKGVSVGKLSSEASGTSFIPAIIVPLPFIAPVQSAACTTLASRLKDFIGG